LHRQAFEETSIEKSTACFRVTSVTEERDQEQLHASAAAGEGAERDDAG
jgi:hypothetical protein